MPGFVYAPRANARFYNCARPFEYRQVRRGATRMDFGRERYFGGERGTSEEREVLRRGERYFGGAGYFGGEMARG